MKLLSALTTLIAFECQSHSICASADDHHERNLLINQADAAQRVNDAVKLAMASVDSGDVNGTALPLNYVAISEGPQQLTVALRLPGVDRDLNILVDTGSSSLAFCDGSLAEEAINITKKDYAQCASYSEPVSCPDVASAPSFSNVFFMGQVFQGSIAAYDINSDVEVASMDDAYFTIMSKQQFYACDGPLDGIIGVAYAALNNVQELPSSDFNVSSMWNQSCVVDGESRGSCDVGDTTTVDLPPPIDQELGESIKTGNNENAAFGLYCDYAATIGSKVDTVVPSLGIYFGGDLAMNNTFYNSGSPQVCIVTQ